MPRRQQLTPDTIIDTIRCTAAIASILAQMRSNPAGISFACLCKICDHYFGSPRQTSGSHRVYKTPWPGDPRVNIQNDRGKAKTYQVKQVLKAIEQWEQQHGQQL